MWLKNNYFAHQHMLVILKIKWTSCKIKNYYDEEKT